MYFNKNSVINSKTVLNESGTLPKNHSTFHISYGIDKNFIFGCGISIASILMNNKDMEFTFHIFTDEFTKKDITEFKELCQQYNTQIIIYIVNCEELKSLPSTKNWSYATYFRFIIADFFYGELETLLYLDADIICKGKLSSLADFQLGDHIAAVVTEGEKEWWDKRATALDDEKISNGYFNAGFLLINITQWGKEDISTSAMRLLSNDEIQRKISFLDQDILNILLVERTVFLGKVYNAQYSINYELKKTKNNKLSILQNAILIHYIGPTKPWHDWARNYICSNFFQEAKQNSPWSGCNLLKAHSTSQLRYRAKHNLHNGEIISGLKSYLHYFIRKTFNY
ncbi:lipopolysaccharide 3-alpha-galactosyltransferase [Samsonia erythrinae]|uniref:UDP-glucose:(Glucosyl)LPS alpha-1, 3-glucosyltransferase/UDP-D-galactose:(Glucosyl)LPS alpha-1,3-D-galactosyltransferase n=1 Tax=Samsonia erythrinae TaxID=160434 RepID=A0A4R3VFP8_9GAMM|nr:lipopolysaccharide 3-alpha-galactosyltransferase [Samsonia erythrinae]TCV02499.1 UDP-glucose:(glucosyl)LPS alpha-1,3-glucosyltransferase/UDP-D-galactose:(glucosyl)LPS alpha-1,3-D-galactosyltransferase [Samsonia erythrinae]